MHSVTYGLHVAMIEVEDGDEARVWRSHARTRGVDFIFINVFLHLVVWVHGKKMTKHV